VLKVRGELDAVTADRFAADAVRELLRAPGAVVVDLSFLDFLDCAGARVLVDVLSASSAGGRPRFAASGRQWPGCSASSPLT
jgi:anti-anti-sigma factor